MRVVITLNFVLVLLNFVGLSQTTGYCGTESTQRYLEQLMAHRDLIVHHEILPHRSLKQYPTSVYIFRYADGSGGMTQAEFDQIFSELNMQLSPSGISLVVCDTIHYIDSDDYYDYNKVQESSLTNQHYASNTLNLYFPNSVTTGGGKILCGYAYFPGWQDVVVVDRHCALDGSSLAHEIGHYFGLIHTHGISNAVPSDELADFSNCIAAGDDVCDTPAEPNLLTSVDSNCVYTGNDMDDAGFPFEPYPFNMMSYAPKPCRTELTEGQYQRMSYTAIYLREYLQCPTLSADFTVSDPLAICTDNHTATLTYNGVGATAFGWDVNNDGIIDYDSSSISHTFSNPGSHTVCLMVSNGPDTIVNCLKDAVTILDFTPLPFHEDFEANTSGTMINPDLHHGWTIGDLGPNYGSRCLVMDNYHYNAMDEEDYYLIGPFEMNTIDVPVLFYDLAYAPLSSDRWDALRIEVSTDCGETFETISSDSSLTLSSINAYMPYQWMPSDSAEWDREQISLSAYQYDTVVIRFTNVTGFGNNLYIDNIDIQQDPLLAFRFLSFDIFAHPGGGHRLVWEVADEYDITGYDIEISVDGIHFEVTDHVVAKDHNVYQHTNRIAPARAFYRVRGLFSNGNSVLSPIRQISSRQNMTTVYPNPAHQILHVRLDQPNNPAAIAVYDIEGRQISVRSSAHGNDGLYLLDVAHLCAGIYTIIAGGLTTRFIKLD